MPNREDDIVAQFADSVVSKWSISDRHGVEHNYASYLCLPERERTDDEADAVDIRFTTRVLQWLGYKDEEYTYNRKQDGRSGNRPDFVAYAAVGTAFVWEDKRTIEEFDATEHIAQLSRYCAGTSGYAIWSNARRILAFKFDPNGRYVTLTDVNVESMFGSQKALAEEHERQAASLRLLYLLFRRDRFTRFEELVKSICLSQAEFIDQAVPLHGHSAQQQFIKGAGQVLEHLRLAALSRISAAIVRRSLVEERRGELQGEWEQGRDRLLRSLTPVLVQAAELPLARISAKLGELSEGDPDCVVTAITEAAKGKLHKPIQQGIDEWLERTSRVDAAIHALRLLMGADINVRDAYVVWKERQPDDQLATVEVFAEQAAYVLFVRLLLARTLEDKGLIENRIASNGGFEEWRKIVERYFGGAQTGIQAHSFIALLAERVASYYRHFYHQPVFDWFIPDDYLLVEALEFLNRYNFSEVTSDILGYTYEEYIDRVARNKKGHFLTRPPVVEYMLDLAGYDCPEVLGRSVIDPACGSGSFLVSAARRYRNALSEALAGRSGSDVDDTIAASPELRMQLAEQFVSALTTLFYGMDLNPFSCYLAELNLLISGLEDIHLLWEKKAFCPIERFHIYNTDSLDLPKFVLDSCMAQSGLGGDPRLLREEPSEYVAEALSLADELVDESYHIKAKQDEYSRGFFYVISNPPYVTRKQHAELDARYRQKPFYEEALSGDMNTYLLFLRLGIHYLAVGGTLCFIVPLTVLGDKSSSAARKLMSKHLVHPAAISRFYSGNVLFPGVDQATAILCLDASGNAEQPLRLAGGYTVDEARDSASSRSAPDVLSATPDQSPWFGAWLVSPLRQSYDLWDHVRRIAGGKLGDLWAVPSIDIRQGDVNTTYVKPFLIDGKPRVSDIAVYKGENIFPYAPLPPEPSSWARLPTSKPSGGTPQSVYSTLHKLSTLEEEQTVLVFREVARLNTRERLNVTVVSRRAERRIAFMHSVWRFAGRSADSTDLMNAICCTMSSKTIAYLLNLFSTNNNVLLGELERILVPELSRLPMTELSGVGRSLLALRTRLERELVATYDLQLPDKDGRLHLPASSVLEHSTIPHVLLSDMELRGNVQYNGAPHKRVGRLLADEAITFKGSTGFQEVVRLLLDDSLEDKWSTVRRTLMVPEPNGSKAFLQDYKSILEKAISLWGEFEALQGQAEELIFDWYGFDDGMRSAILEGLPWARKKN